MDTKNSRVRTNYKLRVGNKAIGRYTPYSQVRTPPSGKYPTKEGEQYYRHPRVSDVIYLFNVVQIQFSTLLLYEDSLPETKNT